MSKVGTQLLLNERDRDRVRALALVRGQLQAEMLRELVSQGLAVYESLSARELTALRDDIERLDVPASDALHALLKAKLPPAVLRGADVFPLPL